MGLYSHQQQNPGKETKATLGSTKPQEVLVQYNRAKIAVAKKELNTARPQFFEAHSVLSFPHQQ